MNDDLLIHGDMLGDKFVIEPHYLPRAERILELVDSKLTPKSVLAIGGPSGSGKSETAALIGSHYMRQGVGTYVLSCDNYAHRPPRDNDANRLQIFEERGEIGLAHYLGTQAEADFDRITRLIQSFRAGADAIPLRIMNCQDNRVEDDNQILLCSDIDLLILEGTWSCGVVGTDIKVFLDTDFHKTLDHRKKRARDPLSPFGELVLRIEQNKLNRLKQDAHYIACPNGHVSEHYFCNWPLVDEFVEGLTA